MKNLTVTEARQIDMVDYLSSLGFQPIKVRGDDYWYLSPFRNERTASFKIKRSSNIWYDHGTGDGGNIIDFGILYHHIDVRGFLELLTKDYSNISFQSQKRELIQPASINPTSNHTDSKILVTATRQLTDPRLLHYLHTRAIAVELAGKYCLEVDFLLYKKKHTAIGFPNETGGYELRNAYFKGGSSPKTFRLISNGGSEVQVFEGFFDFLSWLTMNKHNQDAPGNFLVLNSLSFFQKARPVMESHTEINLWLDHGTAGEACTKAALKTLATYKDKSLLYKEFDDLNDWLVHEVKQSQKQSLQQTNSKNRNHGRI